MKSVWDTYRRKFYSLLSALKSRRSWDTEHLDDIENFERLLREYISILPNKDVAIIEDTYQEVSQGYKMLFPPRIHPHHTAEYRREHYKSKSQYTEEELYQLRTDNLKRGYEEFARDPENRVRKSMYLTHLSPMAKDIKKHIRMMQNYEKDSEEYKLMDEQLTEMVETYEEVREHIKDGDF